MRFEVGQLVRLHANGASVFKVLEVDYMGDQDRVLIESVLDTPGTYPWSTRTTFMVLAED